MDAHFQYKLKPTLISRLADVTVDKEIRYQRKINLLDSTRKTVCRNYSSCSVCLLNGDVCRWNWKDVQCEPRPLFEFIFKCDMKSALDCPKIINPAFAFNATFAKNIMFPLALAANSAYPEKCLHRISNNTFLRQSVTRNCVSWIVRCSGYTAVSEENNAIILGFRATVSPVQVLAQGFFTLLSTSYVLGGGKVSTYYARAFEIIWSAGLEDDLLELRRIYPNYELWITGTSLGGTLATLASHVIVVKRIFEGDKIKLITYGEPRVFDREFSKIHDYLVPYSYRVVYGRDLVPHLAPLLFGFYHRRYEVSINVLKILMRSIKPLGNRFLFTHQQVWFEEGMQNSGRYHICFSPEDCKCSNSAVIYWIFHHFYYYNVGPLPYIHNDCS